MFHTFEILLPSHDYFLYEYKKVQHDHGGTAIKTLPYVLIGVLLDCVRTIEDSLRSMKGVASRHDTHDNEIFTDAPSALITWEKLASAYSSRQVSEELGCGQTLPIETLGGKEQAILESGREY